MVKTTPVQNKELVLQAFETLFNKRTIRRPSNTGHRITFNTAQHPAWRDACSSD